MRRAQADGKDPIRSSNAKAEQIALKPHCFKVVIIQAPGAEMDQGILLVAHGRLSYWDEARTLARSIRRHSSTIRIALASDLGISEAEWRAEGFDLYVPFDFRDYGGVSFKMQLDRITPFTDATLFIDSDSICYGDISGIFDEFAGSAFVTLGRMIGECHWFHNTATILRKFKCDELPFFCGDFYLFRNTDRSKAVFSTARTIAHRYQEFGIKPLGAWCNDEPVFSLAMQSNGVSACDGVGEWIIQLQAQSLQSLSLDYLGGSARGVFEGRAIAPRIVHFQSHRTQPTYCREKYLVHHPSGTLAHAAASRVFGWAESVLLRSSQRWRLLTNAS